MKSLFISPHEITQLFGVNENYYKATGGHEGIDLVPANRVDWGVHVPHGFYNGRVILDADIPGRIYGNAVKVWFPSNGCYLHFCHLSENVVSNGDIGLSYGDLVGIMGNTGTSHRAHVHLNVVPTDKKGIPRSANIKNGKYQDPMFIFDDPFYWVKEENIAKHYSS